jgi:hypothetical protein
MARHRAARPRERRALESAGRSWAVRRALKLVLSREIISLYLMEYIAKFSSKYPIFGFASTGVSLSFDREKWRLRPRREAVFTYLWRAPTSRCALFLYKSQRSHRLESVRRECAEG